MFKSVFWALAAGLPIGKMFYQLKVSLAWKVFLTLLASGIGCLLIFIFPERFFQGGIFLLVLGAFVLLASAKGFADASSWFSCTCYVMYFVAFSFITEGQECISRIGWNDYRGLVVLPCLGYVMGGGVAALRPLGWGRVAFLCSIILLFFNIEVSKSGLAMVPAIIGCFLFIISLVGWNFALKRITPRVVSSGYILSTLTMLILFFL